MQITIAAVGKIKRGAAAELIAEYLKRNRWNVAVQEIADAPSGLPPAARREREAKAILDIVGAQGVLVAMDSTGKNLTSEQLASFIQTAQGNAVKHSVFAIGGQDGLDEALLKKAKLTLSFGAVTWPHQLLRVMLAEQLYRAYTITAGHPYHSGH